MEFNFKLTNLTDALKYSINIELFPDKNEVVLNILLSLDDDLLMSYNNM